MRQWDEYENQGVPTDKRVYWLKRIDGLGFASPEIQAQAAAEVRARVLGMFHQVWTHFWVQWKQVCFLTDSLSRSAAIVLSWDLCSQHGTTTSGVYASL